MRSQSEAVTAIHGSLEALPSGRWLVAVSGGRDSMVLLHALAAARASEIAAVGTFDHGTGRAATRAVRLVERTALELELPVVSGGMVHGQPHSRESGGEVGAGGELAPATEATWRAARWRFLRGWAHELKATILTAHTRDDQVETVVIRILRGSGARGLAGMLAAPSGAFSGGAGQASGADLRGLAHLPSESVLRPLLGVSRQTIDAYARAQRVKFVEDPSNRSLRHQRNRVRHELLPALERAAPGFSDWCWQLGERAAALRTDVERWVDAELVPSGTPDGSVVLDARLVSGLDTEAWALLWPELAARAGVVLDRRGVTRASAWAASAQAPSEIPLSGGATLARTARTFVVRRPSHRGDSAIYIEGSNE